MIEITSGPGVKARKTMMLAKRRRLKKTGLRSLLISELATSQSV